MSDQGDDVEIAAAETEQTADTPVAEEAEVPTAEQTETAELEQSEEAAEQAEVPEDAPAPADGQEAEGETQAEQIDAADDGEAGVEPSTGEQAAEENAAETPATETEQEAAAAEEPATEAEPADEAVASEAGGEAEEQSAEAAEETGAEQEETNDDGAEEPSAEPEAVEPAAEAEETTAESEVDEDKQVEAEAEEQATEVEIEQPAAETEEPVEVAEQTNEAVAEEQTAEADADEPADEAEPEASTGEQEVTPEGEQAAEGDETVAEGEQLADTEEKQDADQVVQAEAAAEEEKPEEPVAEQEATTADAATERTDQVPEVDPQAASPRSQFPADATATVKFMLMPSGQMVTQAFTLGQTVEHFKQHFSSELKIPTASIIVLYEGKTQENDVTLGSLGVQPNGTIQFEVQSADPANVPLGQYRPRDDYHMPDVISVRVQLDNGDYKDVVVEISRSTKKKPFLGGYRHKKTGVEYHHASAQTVAKPPPPPLCELNCRETQTVQQKQQVQQTTNDMSTQMTGIGVYVSNMTDVLVTPGHYTTADERATMIVGKIVTLQKYFRRWYAKRYVAQVREDRDQRLEWERQEEERKKKEKEDRIKREFERRMNPKTKEDFDLLYHALEKWRLEELELIDKTLSGAERKAALCQLLEQETQLIASIGRNKLEADTANRDKRIQRFLGKAAAPKRWKGRDGKWTQMDTPYTIRARELMDIYNSVQMKYLTQDERLDVLLTLKHTVKEHDCKLTQEIIELIDREADLLMRGVKEANLEGLRKRISTLFLQYIKTPTFNPEITKYLKVPQDPATLRKNIYLCSSCQHYLPSTEFHLASNESSMGKCRRCRKVDNDARVRQDYSYYRHMLKNLRQAEEQFQDSSKIAFLMQEGDLRYLVENVWNSQSMLSAWDDLYDLELVRWDVRDEWSPWNTILLTKEEAAAHAKLENLEEGYGKVFVHKAQHKHTLARNYFSRLPGMAELMRQRDIEEEKKREEGGGSMPRVRGKRVSVQASA